MDSKEFKQFEKKHTVIGKKAKAWLIAGCALLGVGTITLGSLYTYNLLSKKDSSGSSEELEKKIIDLTKQIADKEAKIKELEESGTKYEQEIITLKKEISDLKIEIEEIKKELDAEKNNISIIFLAKDGYTVKYSTKIVKNSSFTDAEITELNKKLDSDCIWTFKGSDLTSSISFNETSVINETEFKIIKFTADYNGSQYLSNSNDIKIGENVKLTVNIGANLGIEWIGADSRIVPGVDFSTGTLSIDNVDYTSETTWDTTDILLGSLSKALVKDGNAHTIIVRLNDAQVSFNGLYFYAYPAS